MSDQRSFCHFGGMTFRPRTFSSLSSRRTECQSHEGRPHLSTCCPHVICLDLIPPFVYSFRFSFFPAITSPCFSQRKKPFKCRRWRCSHCELLFFTDWRALSRSFWPHQMCLCYPSSCGRRDGNQLICFSMAKCATSQNTLMPVRELRPSGCCDCLYLTLVKKTFVQVKTEKQTWRRVRQRLTQETLVCNNPQWSRISQISKLQLFVL